jgi:hypothetical protein
VDGGECASTSDEFDELVVITRQPLLPKRSGYGRAKSQGLSRRVDVEDGDTR